MGTGEAQISQRRRGRGSPGKLGGGKWSPRGAPNTALADHVHFCPTGASCLGPSRVRSHWKRPPAILSLKRPLAGSSTCPETPSWSWSYGTPWPVPSRITPRRSPRSQTSPRLRASRSATAHWAWWTCPGTPSASACTRCTWRAGCVTSHWLRSTSSVASGSSPTRRARWGASRTSWALRGS